MHLKPIQPGENRQDAAYATEACQQLLDLYDSFYPKAGFTPPWVGYFIVHEGAIAGSCGFTGKPENGSVELAYWTFPEYEGRGIATRACGQLLEIAAAADPALTVTAKTAPEHNASTRILLRHGFTFAAVVQDEEIGDAWLWTRAATGNP